MSRTRRSAITLLGSWLAAAGVRSAAATGLPPSQSGPDTRRSPNAHKSGPMPACLPSHIAVSLKVTDYPEQPGSYRWDADTAITDCARKETTRASTWGYRKIGLLGLLRAEGTQFPGIEMRGRSTVRPAGQFVNFRPAGSQVVTVSFSFEGAPPIWPTVNAA